MRVETRTDIVVHIGTHRTGSTALQHFLSLNHGQLLDEGIQYLAAGRGGTNPENHHSLAFALDNGQPAPVAALRQELDAVGERTAVISSEMLVEFDSAPVLAQVLEGHRVRIVVFVRRQDLRLESGYRQMVKSSVTRLAHTMWDHDSLRHYHWRHDYYLLLTPFAEHFGSDAITVIPYDEPRDPTFVYRAFLEALSVPWSTQLVEPPPLQRNHSLDNDCLELKRLSNRDPLPLDDDLALARGLEAISAARPRHSVRSLLPPGHRARIRKRYEYANRRTALTYLGRPELFSTTPESEDWEPYRGATPEARDEIVARLDIDPGLKRRVIGRFDPRRSRRVWSRGPVDLD